MRSLPRIALLNPNTSSATTTTMVGIAGRAAEGQAVFEGHTVPSGPAVVTTELELVCAAEEVLRAGTLLGSEGFDGILVAGFGDPGLARLREAVSIPVTGIAEAALLDAAAGGRRFSIVTTTPGLKVSIEATVAAYGLVEGLTEVRITPGTAEDTMSDPDKLAEALERECLSAVAQAGAEAIVIGGGPLAEAAERIAATMPVEVINPVAAGARLACQRASEHRLLHRDDH